MNFLTCKPALQPQVPPLQRKRSPGLSKAIFEAHLAVFCVFFLQNMDGLNKIKPFTATVNNMEKHDWTNKNCDLSHGDQQYVTQRPEQPISCSLWQKPSDHGTWESTFGMLHLRPIIKQWFMHSYGGHFEKQSFSDTSKSFVHLLHPYHPKSVDALLSAFFRRLHSSFSDKSTYTSRWFSTHQKYPITLW